ncbi:MAG: hypothetical protein HY036_11895 [Nitrospirae bacterium]|nr:hypothetical protein [Nitrospirota bacterium]
MNNVSVGSVTPNLFTGTMGYTIPIKVPPGHKGINPNLSLSYRNNSGNSWVGASWELEVGAIERSTRFGLNFSGTDFIYRMPGNVVDLVTVPGGEYRAKIESAFIRIQYNGTYWTATDKTGTQYLFGESSATRQDDPGNANRVFKWALDKVIDPNGNTMTLSYIKDNGQIYLSQIDYTGNGAISAPYHVKFYMEARPDYETKCSSGFCVKNLYRLKTIDILGGTGRIGSYKLTYSPGPFTSRSLLSGFQQFGKDAAVDSGTGVIGTGGAITNESTATKIPAISMQYQKVTSNYWNHSQFDSYSTGQLIFGDPLTQGSQPLPQSNWQTIQYADINGDGKPDTCMRSSDGIRCYLSGKNLNGWGTYPLSGDQWIYSLEFDTTGSTQIFADPTPGFTALTATIDDNWPTFRLIDVNGDGKADACIRLDLGIQCYLSNGNGWDYSAGYDSTGASQPANTKNIFASNSNQFGMGAFDQDNWQTLQYGDLNGDGKIDVCIRMDYGLQCFLSKSDGTGWNYISGYDSHATGQNIFANGSNQYGFGVFDQDNWQTFQLVDVNGDGKADACIRMDYGLKCVLSTGAGWDLTNSAGYDSYATGQYIFKNNAISQPGLGGSIQRNMTVMPAGSFFSKVELIRKGMGLLMAITGQLFGLSI